MPGKPGELPKEVPPGSNNWVWADGTTVTPEEDAALKADASGQGGDTGVTGYTDVYNRTGVPLSLEPGATLDTTGADAVRERQNSFIQAMQQQAASGDGAWRQRFADAVRRSLATAQAVGQSNPNVGYQSAMRNITNAQGAISQRAVGEEEMLREQAKMDARGRLADVLGAQSALDLDQSAMAAGVRQQRRRANVAQQEASQQDTKQIVGGFAQAVPLIGGGLSSVATSGLSHGGEVPGRAVFGGDDPRNDTVPAWLSPDEIVVPRTAADDPSQAAAFARAVAKTGRPPPGYAGGGGDRRKFANGGGVRFPRNAQRLNLGGIPTEEPTIDNGGLLDTTHYDQTAGRQDQLAAIFAGDAAGMGPSVTPYLQQRASDSAVGAAMAAQGQGGIPAADILQAMAEAGVANAADVGRQRGVEQSQAQGVLARHSAQRRAQELQLAGAKQKAAWNNTMLNSGITLANQALLKDLASGAGQAITSYASQPRSYSSDYTGPYEEDYRGERGGPADLGSSEPDFGEWDNPFGKAYGGVVGMSGGGKVAKPKVDEERAYSAEVRRAARLKRKQAEWDEEEAGTYSEKKPMKPTEEESAFARAVRGVGRFVQRAAGSVRGMADGGTVGYQSYDPFALPPRRDSGPMYAALPSDAGVPASSFPMGTEIPGQGVPPQAPSMLDNMFSPAVAKAIPEVARSVGESLIGPPGAAPLTMARMLEQPEKERESLGIKPRGASGPPAPEQGPEYRPELMTTKRTQPGGASQAVDAEEMATRADEQAAARAMYDAETAKAQAEVGAAKARADAIETAEKERRAVTERAQLRVDEAMRQWQTAQAEFNRPDAPIDMNRFWATRTTGDKVLSILGLALGAMGTGPDGINRAATMLNQAIDRDIDAQKFDHEMKLKKGARKLEGAQSYYGMARGMAQDELAATELAKAAALDAAAAKGEQMVAATNDQGAKARMQQMSAALRRASLDRQAKAKEKMLDRAVEWAKVDASRVKGPGSADRVKMADDVNTAAGNIVRNAQEMKSLINQYGTDENRWTGPGVAKNMDLLSDSLATEMAKMLDPSTGVRDQEMERWSANVFRRGYAQTKEDALASLNNIIKTAEARRQNALRVRGMQ